MQHIKIILRVLLIFIFPAILPAQNDTLLFKNGNIIVGEIKSMNHGVLQIETDYSDTDFQIEWHQVSVIKTSILFFITLTDESKYYGTLRSDAEGKVSILSGGVKSAECDLNEIVYLQQLRKGFWDRLYASIDLGSSLTKANDLRQWTSRSTLGFRTEKQYIEATFNTLRSTQKETDPIERSDGRLNYLRVLVIRWYSIATVSLASNTEQKLDMRMNLQLGAGRFLVRTNSAYWGINLGLNRNVEKYTGDTPNRNTWESYLGSELNLYDIGDLSLLTKLMAYPGLTEKGRLRADFNLDTKYDLPFNFYIKIGLTVNYDNRPAEGAAETDYVFQTGFGWEW
jgi:hypothetical protein